MPEEKEEVLLADRLCSGDRPSVYITGMVVAHAIRANKMAILMVDVLGRVVAMPPESVKILAKPLLSNTELNALSEDEAIALMVSEARDETDILTYLKTRGST
jgi:hypothetical protein